MAHADARMALSAGLITVALAIGGPCVTAASADPGHWGSSHGNGNSHATAGNDSNSGRDGARHGQDGRSRSDDNRGERAGDRGGHGNRRHDGNGRNDGNGRYDGNRRYDGNGGYDGNVRNDGNDQPAKSDSEATSGGSQIAARSATVSAVDAPVTTVSTFDAPVTAEAIPQDTPAVPAAPAIPEASGGGSGGTQVVAPIATPHLTFGNGRTPGTLSGGPDEPTIRVNAIPTGALSAPNLPPEPVLALPAPVTVVPIAAPRSQEFIDRIWAPLRPSFGDGLAFGIAGLVVLPLLGVWLGYRQARASRTEAEVASQ